jgi:hypothetical protein
MGLLDTILNLLGMGKKDDAEPASGAGDAEPHHAAAADEPEAEQEEEASDDDDDFRRDYDLEAKDDMGKFDFRRDLKAFYVAQFEIERGWEDKEERHQLLAKHGVRNEQHWYQIKATLERYLASAEGRAKWGDAGDVSQIQMDATMDLMRGQMADRAESALKAELEPVEGVTLQQWAQWQAKIAGGGSPDDAMKALGIDRAKWDRVSAEWNARMSRDTTATIATEYAKHFSGAGVGAFGGAAAAGAGAMGVGGSVGDDESKAPIPFERYVEIEQAQNFGVQQGKDASAILQSFGMTILDWSSVGAWWSQFIARNAMKNNGALHRRYTELQARFEAKYKAAKADDDLSF